MADYLYLALQAREPTIETELIYALAKCDRLVDLEEFINSPNVIAKVGDVGDRCFDAGMHSPAGS